MLAREEEHQNSKAVFLKAKMYLLQLKAKIALNSVEIVSVLRLKIILLSRNIFWKTLYS